MMEPGLPPFLPPGTGTKVLFFVGKGGVGKTTSAAAMALCCARRGMRTLIASLDPAHNLGDVLETRLSDKPQPVCPGLEALEVDIDEVTSRYLEGMASRLKSIYRYMVAFNLDRYLDTLRFSPGIEEAATLEALRELLERRTAYRIMVFDTPPTGLMLRVMALPSVSLLWLEKLTELRERILEQRRMVERVQGERRMGVEGVVMVLPSTRDKDPVMRELAAHLQEVQEANRILCDPSQTGVVLVMNAERLPLVEARRAATALSKFGIPLAGIVINRVCHLGQPCEPAKRQEEEAIIDQVRRDWPRLRLVQVPLFPQAPLGLAGLELVGRCYQ